MNNEVVPQTTYHEDTKITKFISYNEEFVFFVTS